MSAVSDSAHLALVELEADIIRNLRLCEGAKLPSISLVLNQPQVSWEMRPQLLEFLAQAQAALELLPETLVLAVNILDRYMSKRVVHARHYQLLGCVCLWLAAKTVDDKHKVPTSCVLSYLCGGSYADSMFPEMELHVLATLDWSVLAPTSLDFLDLNVAEAARHYGGETFGPDEYTIIRCMTQYACECALFGRDTAGCKPSVIAATAVSLSTIVLDMNESRGWLPYYPLGCNPDCFDALAAVLADPPLEIAGRHVGNDQCQASCLFARFFEAFGPNALYPGHYPSYSLWPTFFGASKAGHYLLGEEPSTPIKSRHISMDSRGTVSPLDDELTSPEDSIPSPHTQFVPLTPDELFSESNVYLLGFPGHK